MVVVPPHVRVGPGPEERGDGGGPSLPHRQMKRRIAGAVRGGQVGSSLDQRLDHGRVVIPHGQMERPVPPLPMVPRRPSDLQMGPGLRQRLDHGRIGVVARRQREGSPRRVSRPGPCPRRATAPDSGRQGCHTPRRRRNTRPGWGSRSRPPRPRSARRSRRHPLGGEPPGGGRWIQTWSRSGSLRPPDIPSRLAPWTVRRRPACFQDSQLVGSAVFPSSSRAAGSAPAASSILAMTGSRCPCACSGVRPRPSRAFTSGARRQQFLHDLGGIVDVQRSATLTVSRVHVGPRRQQFLHHLGRNFGCPKTEHLEPAREDCACAEGSVPFRPKR